ncbi:hypothetical protein K1T71_001674 [Dendrolimus kikuchii]|uniref:Uncharacterized protein n=1 Tax=Dendrolimus kikuchii TaxID=765133 RepID=A0ACC1DET6_9NEOP|nr:hypothetical protein K1T71_001674 [Dendrolimus kikuchii]
MAEGMEDTTKENEEKNLDVHNVISTLRPIILFEYCCGIFRFSETDNKLSPPNGKMKAYSVVICCIITSVTMLFLPLPGTLNDSSSFSDIMDKIMYLLLLIQYLTNALITCFLNCRNNIRIFSMFAELDKTLNINCDKTFYASSKARIVTYLTILCIMHILLTLYVFITREITPLNIIAAALYFIQKLIILIFCVMIMMLKRRLDIINDYITKFVEENDNNIVFVYTVIQSRNKLNKTYNWIGRPSDENMKIHDLALAYDQAGTICSLINDIFNFQMFMILITTFICIVVTIWILLHYYLSNGNDIGFIIIIALWSTALLLNIVVMSFACENLLSARKETKVLVNKIIMNYDLPKIMRNQAKAFMELIEAWPLSIMVYDMFSVDVTLILKFISVATTYLIVAVQMSHFI